MTTIATILTEGYADWEIGLLAGVARTYFAIDILNTAPGGKPVLSGGGFVVMPDRPTEHLDPRAIDALVVVGGTAWRGEAAPDICRLLNTMREADIMIAGICDGTRALAKAGLLDEVGHTSNSPETLIETGYRGRQLYWDVPHAVSADGIVTAPGTAPVSFMAEVVTALGHGGSDLEFFQHLLAAEHASRLHLPSVILPGAVVAH
jgi:transcriptional regulator GlxA family with amidase domain